MKWQGYKDIYKSTCMLICVIINCCFVPDLFFLLQDHEVWFGTPDMIKYILALI